MRISLLLVCIVFAIGCSSTSPTTLIHLGGGNALTTEAVDKIAKDKGITRKEAVEQMRTATANKRVSEHAAKYGISEEQAREQLAFGDKHESIPYLQYSNQQAANSID